MKKTEQVTPENLVNTSVVENKKGNPLGWFGLGMLVTVLVGSGIYYFAYASKAPLQPSPPPVAQASPVDDLTTGWQTYNNDLYEYQIKLPPDWKQIELSSNFPNMTRFQAPDESTFEVVVYENQGQTLAQFLKNRDEQNRTGWEGQPSINIIRSKEVNVGDYSGIERTEELLAAGFAANVTYLPVGDFIFTFSSLPNSDKEITQTEAGQNFHLIVSSFVYERLGRY